MRPLISCERCKKIIEQKMVKQKFCFECACQRDRERAQEAYLRAKAAKTQNK